MKLASPDSPESISSLLQRAFIGGGYPLDGVSGDKPMPAGSATVKAETEGASSENRKGNKGQGKRTKKAPGQRALSSTKIPSDQTASLSDFSIRPESVKADENAALVACRGTLLRAEQLRVPKTQDDFLKIPMAHLLKNYQSGDHEKIEIFCAKLDKNAEEKPANAFVIKRFLNRLRCMVRQEKAASPLYEIKSNPSRVVSTIRLMSREEFVDWHLAMVQTIANGQIKTENPRLLELYCYRQASEAGSSEARRWLLTELLFQNERQPDFAIEEAQRILTSMAASWPESRLTVTSELDTVINQLAEGMAEKTSVNRTALSEMLLKSDNTLVKQLAPWAFICPVFGKPDHQRVAECFA